MKSVENYVNELGEIHTKLLQMVDELTDQEGAGNLAQASLNVRCAVEKLLEEGENGKKLYPPAGRAPMP